MLPIIGYLIVFNDTFPLSFARLQTLAGASGTGPSSSPVATASAGEPVSWRLLASYFGLCFVGAASAMYQAFAPSEVKVNATSTDYVQFVRQNLGPRQERAIFSYLQTTRYADEARERGGRYLTELTAAATEAVRKHAAEMYDRDILVMNYEALNESRPLERSIALWLYAIGFSILTVPSADVFFRVLLALMHRVRSSFFL